GVYKPIWQKTVCDAEALFRQVAQQGIELLVQHDPFPSVIHAAGKEPASGNRGHRSCNRPHFPTLSPVKPSSASAGTEASQQECWRINFKSLAPRPMKVNPR